MTRAATYWLVWNQESCSPVYWAFLSFILHSKKKKNPSTNAMNISSNQSHKEKKIMFTVRKNAKVAPGCKYKREKLE